MKRILCVYRITPVLWHLKLENRLSKAECNLGSDLYYKDICITVHLFSLKCIISTWGTYSGLEAKLKLSVILSISIFTFFFLKVNCFIKGRMEVRNVPLLQIINVGNICRKEGNVLRFCHWVWGVFSLISGLESFACVLELVYFCLDILF